MNKHITGIATLFSMLLLTACSKSTATSEPLPGFDISVQNINTTIKLDDSPDLANSHKNGDLLSLGLTNLSDQSIIFPKDFGIRVITIDGQKWIDIPNNNFTGSELHFLPTRKSYPVGLIVDTRPYVAGLSSAIKIRVVVVGHIESISGEPVGAYLDVKINP